MAVQWLLVRHGLVTLLVVVSFLCGQWPIFQGTFIQCIHNFLTFGAFDYFRRFVEFVFGSRGTNALYLTQYYCCDRPNPILQMATTSKITISEGFQWVMQGKKLTTDMRIIPLGKYDAWEVKEPQRLNSISVKAINQLFGEVTTNFAAALSTILKENK